MSDLTGYCYLHTNGEVIMKAAVGVGCDPSDYFDSDFVKKWWKVNPFERGDCWKVVLEALALGANKDRIKELAKKWGLDFDDAVEMMFWVEPTRLMKVGFWEFVPLCLGMTEDEFFVEGGIRYAVTELKRSRNRARILTKPSPN